MVGLSWPRWTSAVLLLLVAALSAGCDWVEKKAEQAKIVVVNQSARIVEKAKETVHGAGEIGLALSPGPAVKCNGCYATLTTLSGGRPAVFQVTSYHDPNGESFPALLFWAQTTAKAPADLANKPLQGQLHFQTDSQAPVWQSPDNEPVTLQIQTVADGSFTGIITAGRVVSTENTQSATVTGNVGGSIK